MSCACAECDELREENRELRRQLLWEMDKDLARRIHDKMSVTRFQSKLLASLYLARGRAVNQTDLMDLSERAEEPLNSLRSHISNLRKRLGREAIVAHCGFGYSLAAEGIAIVERALAASLERAA